MRLVFQDLSFEDRKDLVRVNLYKIFFLEIPKDELSGFQRCQGHEIFFDIEDEKRAMALFLRVLDKHLPKLKNSLTGKKAVYIHRNSNIPLIGNVSFGIVDRNTTLIEVKPITGCNLSCIYCSVNQDRRVVDFVVEKDYLVEELQKLVALKGAKGLEIHINSNGEPLLYEPLDSLIKDIHDIPEVSVISIDTNATLLTKEKVDSLIRSGLNRFNVSLNAIDPECSEMIAGKPYNVGKVISICKYIAQNAELLIAPVFLPTINDQELIKLIQFANSLKARIGFQNFLSYKDGRNPVKALPMAKFFEKLWKLEKLTGTRLVCSESDFNIRKTLPLRKPFSKGDRLKAEIVCDGRLPKEKIATALGRSIALPNCDKTGSVLIRITGDKHNIFYGAVKT